MTYADVVSQTKIRVWQTMTSGFKPSWSSSHQEQEAMKYRVFTGTTVTGCVCLALGTSLFLALQLFARTRPHFISRRRRHCTILPQSMRGEGTVKKVEGYYTRRGCFLSNCLHAHAHTLSIAVDVTVKYYHNQ